MKMLVSLQVMGIVGCTIYVSILLFSLYQLLLFCSPFRWNFFSTRKMFHILLLIYCILQILSVQNFLQDKFFGKWTFTSHLFAVCAEICAVSMVAVLWSKTLVSSNTAYRKIVPLLVVVDGFFIGYTIMVCADMDASSSSFTRWTESSVFFRYMLLLEPIALVVNGFCLAYLGIRIRSRLIRDPSWEKLPAQQKRMVLFRLIGTMVVCCTCFLLRASLLLWLFVQGDVVISEKPSWILSTWVPSLLPVCVLTYTMRRTEVDDAEETSTEGSQPGSSASSHSTGRCLPSLANAMASAMTTGNGDAQNPAKRGGGGLSKRAPGEDFLDSFDQVIAPLLATSLLSHGMDADDEEIGGSGGGVGVGATSRDSSNGASTSGGLSSGGGGGRMSSTSTGSAGHVLGGRGSVISPQQQGRLVRSKRAQSDSDVSDA